MSRWFELAREGQRFPWTFPHTWYTLSVSGPLPPPQWAWAVQREGFGSMLPESFSFKRSGAAPSASLRKMQKS
jgi:hypothetical protein